MQAKDPLHPTLAAAPNTEGSANPALSVLELRKEQAAGGLLQQRMLPRSPVDLEGFRIEFEIFPASQLSGDFVDVTQLNAQRFAFIVADVAGHGVSAALLTVLLKSFMCRLPQLGLESPAAILTALNAELLALGVERHICVLCGVVDQQTSVLTCAGAGAYPKPLLVRANSHQAQPAQVLEISGKAIGLFAAVSFVEQTVELQRHDRLVVMTDGVFELLSGKNLQAQEQLLAVAAVQKRSTDFWAALQVTPGNGSCDDITRFQLERVS